MFGIAEAVIAAVEAAKVRQSICDEPYLPPYGNFTTTVTTVTPVTYFQRCSYCGKEPDHKQEESKCTGCRANLKFR